MTSRLTTLAVITLSIATTINAVAIIVTSPSSVASKEYAKMQFQSISRLAHQIAARDRHAAHVARYGRPEGTCITKVPAPPEDWHLSKQVALLRIYRTECAKDCIAHLGDGIRATQQDFADLRDEGIAFRRELARFHELTPTGLRFARETARLVANRLGLHHVSSDKSAGHHAAQCTCGWRLSLSERYGRTENQISKAVTAHLETTSHG